MKSLVHWVIIAIWLCPLAKIARADAPEEGVLSIDISGNKSEKGNIVAFLWDQPKGFPSDSKKKIAMVIVRATIESCSIRFWISKGLRRFCGRSASFSAEPVALDPREKGAEWRPALQTA